MSVSIYRPDNDGLSRQCWTFAVSATWGERITITLVRYGVERRKQVKGRYSAALPADRWLSSDERSYTSGLDRPAEIPADVLSEAVKAMDVRFYIGWPTPEHELALSHDPVRPYDSERLSDE